MTEKILLFFEDTLFLIISVNRDSFAFANANYLRNVIRNGEKIKFKK